MILYAYDADHWPEALVRAAPGGLGAGANIAGGLGIDGPLRSGYLGCEEEGAVEATHANPFGLFLCGRGVEGHEPRWSSQTSRLRPRESPPVALSRTPNRLARGLVPRRLAVSVRLPSLGVFHVRFRRKVRRKSIGAPRVGVRNPRVGVRNPRVGVRNPRVGVRNPRVGVRNPALPGGLETTSRGCRYFHLASLFAHRVANPKERRYLRPHLLPHRPARRE
jgi:hypothetical protein